MTKTKEIISRFMRSDMPAEISMQFRRWIISGHNKAEKGAVLAEEWEKFTPEDELSPEERHFRLGQLHLKMEKSHKSASCIKTPKRHYVRWAAAGIVLLAGLMTAEYFILEDRLTAETSETICMVTAVDSKGEFMLPDGSHVWLNSGSRLEYGDDFMTSGERNVHLDGEAIFDVAKDGRTFKVNADNMEVKVLGTRFAVRCSKTYSENQVTLLTGKVQVGMDGFDPIILQPSQQLSMDRISGGTVVKKVDTNLYTCWTDSHMHFDNTPLKDIIECLEHWYNVEITVGQGVDTDFHISFTLTPEPMEDTFRILSALIGYPCRIIDNSKVLIYSLP